MHQDSPTPEEFEQLVALEGVLASLSVETRRIADESGLSRRALAERMGLDSETLWPVHKLLSGAAYNSTLEEMARFALACGYTLEVKFVPLSK